MELILKVLGGAYYKRDEESSRKVMHKWTVFGIYITISYVISLRGSEGFLLDLRALREKNSITYPGYIWLSLLGKLKGEGIYKQHHIPCVDITSSGINVKERITKLIREKERLGFTQGPAISDISGQLLTSVEINQMLNELLEDLYLQEPSLFPPDIQTLEDISASCHCF